MRNGTLVVLVGCGAIACGGGQPSGDASDAAVDTPRSGSDANGADATRADASHTGSDASHAMTDAAMTDAATTVDTGPVMEGGNPGQSDLTFTVDSTRDVHAISPYVYGHNFPDWTQDTNVTITRMGGDRLTAYNWVTGASNAGSDYLFQNDDLLCSMPSCSMPGEATRLTVDPSFANNAAVILTVPIAGYVAADTNGGGDVRNSGANYLMTRFHVTQPLKGSAFSLTPSASAPIVYADEYVNFVNTTYPNAHSDPVNAIFYEMDNEPDIWSSTHAEIHPTPVTYAELVQRNTDYAGAVKSVVPDAIVFGPVDYGFAGYENLQSATDANGRDWIEFYLDSMQAAEQTAGHRLVDVLDLHWYPEATGGGIRITDDGTGAAEVAARLQAPRSLWDPTYVETSWITCSLGNMAIQLIPSMQSKIAMHYPGTRLAFTEYWYGAGGDISGGIAEADVLGIFGRESVFAATAWPLSNMESFVYAALKMYRNYDGQHSTFGDTSIHGDTTDVVNSSVYASVDASNPSRMIIVAINKSSNTLRAGISITHTVQFHSAAVYQLTSANAQPAAAAAVTISGSNAFVYPMPPMSVSTLVLSP